MLVKICGITNLEDALYCEKAGADALGFIFYDKSPRYVLPSAVANIARHLKPSTLLVGVFVNENANTINSIAISANLSLIQLHGDEPEGFEKELLIPNFRAYRIEDNFSFDIIRERNNALFLADSYSKSKYGGTGNSFDYSLIPSDLRNRVIVAGGVSAENIVEIMEEIKPYGVDLSSSLEEKYGKKDYFLVDEFFNKIKNVKNKLC